MGLGVFLFQVCTIGVIDCMLEAEGVNTRRPWDCSLVSGRLTTSKIRCRLYKKENRSYKKRTVETLRMNDMEKKK